jgi:glycine/D-amino acid oxidase-like deaminating enzyme
MKVAVIGAGWYGCHVACQLLELGIEVEVFEQNAEVFMGASGFNQNRLHLGFHYPRSAQTRREALRGYERFKSVYPYLSEHVARNFYAVADGNSIVDADTYRQIMAASGLEWLEVDPAAIQLRGVSAALEVREDLVLTSAARTHFKTRLKSHLRLQTTVQALVQHDDRVLVDREPYGLVVDCTWGALSSAPWSNIFFEPCIVLVYEARHAAVPAVTLMDGPFFSIYPFERGLYTLTSVTHTPLARVPTGAAATEKLRRLQESDVSSIRRRMEAEALHYYPAFLDDFAYSGFFGATKTKRPSRSDARDPVIQQRGRVIHVLSGKIDTIFTTGDYVKKAVCDY